MLASNISTTSRLYLDGSSFLPYGGDVHLGAVLAVLGLYLDRRQILLRHPHSQTLHRHEQQYQLQHPVNLFQQGYRLQFLPFNE